MKICTLPLLAACVALVRADPVEIKLATILPAGTSGEQRLQELRDGWRKTAAPAVKLTILPGSPEGEAILVKKMRSGQNHAALISAVGLAEIDRAVTCLQLMPLVFRDWREVDYVREKIRGDLEARLREKGFDVLFWADAGWVRFFSKQPALHPADLKPMKLFVWAGEPHQLEIMRSFGYHPIGLETEQILPCLSTGMINAVPVPPFLANALQYTRYAGNMLDLNWVPIVGAAVVDRRTWEKIPAETRAELQKAARHTGERIRAQCREEDAASVAAMRKRGLKVQTPTPEIVAEWQAMVEQAYPKIRGSMVPTEVFDRVISHVKEFRAAEGANPP